MLARDVAVLRKYYCIMVIEIACNIDERQGRINLVTADRRLKDMFIASLRQISIKGVYVYVNEDSKHDRNWRDKFVVRITGRERFEALLKNYPFDTEKRRMIKRLVR
jgi:hypothetical protein